MTRKRRADALENRDRIVAGARAAFGAGGLDVPTRAVARTAGVGVATVYRHFPSRGELVDAVLDELVAGCERDLRAAVGQADPRAGLELVVRGFAGRRVAAGGLGEVLLRRFPAQRADHAAQLDALVARAVRAGVVRDGLTVRDVRAGLMGIAGVGAVPEAATRLTEVVLAGILA
ncbi:helix-turn-helix domain-containing protein [Dactylosporangium sp. NPDC000244]|uniref:TetR/AcrR family transcriptional regulator n=1 Tax=Dactylosporangium sp. NPDC000244 TaxID=3154365 RepID=UPI003321DC6A